MSYIADKCAYLSVFRGPAQRKVSECEVPEESKSRANMLHDSKGRGEKRRGGGGDGGRFTRLFVPAPCRQRKRILAAIGRERREVSVIGRDEGEDELAVKLGRAIKGISLRIPLALHKFIR